MGTSWLNLTLTFPLSLHFILMILQYSHHHIRFLSHCLHIPRTHCHLFFLIPTLSPLSFPCVPINPFPVHSSTQGLSVPIMAGPSSPPAHTHSAHTASLSLSLYQLGINLLKQRASWRAAHCRPCEVLPLHRSTLLPILGTTHSTNLFFPLFYSQNKSGPKVTTKQMRVEKASDCSCRVLTVKLSHIKQNACVLYWFDLCLHSYIHIYNYICSLFHQTLDWILKYFSGRTKCN